MAEDTGRSSIVAASEFAGRAPLLLASAVGLSTGMTATMFYSLGAFMPSLQAAFGWARGDISLGVTIMTIGLFLSGPIAGRLCDRWGAALIGTASLVGYAMATIAMTLLLHRIEQFWFGYFVIAILGAGSTPIVLVRPVTAAFRARRGLALGIALTGAGIAGFWVPLLTQAVASSYGWQAAYIALAGCALLASPLIWFGFRSADPARLRDAGSAAPPAGLTALEARRTKTYWILSFVALAMASGVAGLVVHLVPMFRDLGAEPASAARMASIVGLASVAGRLVVGLLLDRFPPALVSAVILAMSAGGALLLWASGLQFAILSVALFGLAAGAELDLLAFLTARYFGQRAYGAIYGWQYSIFALGYGLSPFVIGRLRDSFGNYDIALLGSAGLMIPSAIALLALGHSGRPAA